MSNLPRNITVPPTAATYGSSITKGIRIGAAAAQEGSVPASSGSHSPIACPSRLNLDQWGPGVYTGGLFTYRIMPKPINERAGAPSTDNNDNIVKQITLATTNLGEYLALDSYKVGPRATQVYTNEEGKKSVMFDFARCINVYSPVAQTANIKVGIWGFDIYGQRMMETITTTGGGDVYRGNKAFQGVTAVYLYPDYTGTFVAGQYFAVGTSNAFGLPFCLDQACHMVAYSQGDIRMQTAISDSSWQEVSNNFPNFKGGISVDAVDTNPGIVFLPYQLGTPDYVWGADITTPTATTKDVRGIFKPGNGFIWNTINSPFDFEDATTTLLNWPIAPYSWATFTYYIAGADMYQDIIQAQINNWRTFSSEPNVFDGLWARTDQNVPARNQNNMKGLPQYWEEPPHA